ncbi:MAG: HindVP family restriction endonuclease [Lachnospiraceae bacterium]|nr:HindVP family restriction endonuclease [Lachnospiraceae bacterium]
MKSGLFGIEHSNRSGNDHWGKNCFNSSFPTAMASFMLANSIPAIYIHLDQINGKLNVVADEIPIQNVFNSGSLKPQDLYFSFESVYEPYQKYSFDSIDGIDLVVKGPKGEYLSPLEVKLTVLPTDSTSQKPEEDWGCELVIRSATTSYCALGMFDTINAEARHIRELFEDACASIQMWDNDFEMTHKMPQICGSIDSFQREYFRYQKPLLMQTIWKTQGKSPLLADQAFDIVIWSDYAFSRLFIDGSDTPSNTMKRPMRATARLARCLWELSKSGKIRMVDIYRQMAFGNQTDKEFAIGGSKWRQFVRSNRIVRPILPSSVVNEIIEPGNIERLSPERRFDQTLYFTVRGR